MTIYRILQANDGRIWLGTDQGLSRFNGFQFQSFGPAEGLPGSEVIGKALDDSNRVWVGTFSGAIGFVKDGQFFGHEQEDWIPKIEGVPMTLAQLSNGDLVTSTQDAVWLFGPARKPKLVSTKGLGFTRFAYDHPDRPMSMLHKNGEEFPISEIGDPLIPIDRLEGLPQGWSTVFYQNLSGIVTEPKIKRVLAESAFIRSAEAVLNRHCASCMVVTRDWDQKGNMWMGTKNHGLYVVRRSDLSLVKALEDGEIIVLLNDRSGNMWVGTKGNGLFMFRENDLNAYHLDQSTGLLENNVNFLGIADAGHLLLGYSSGKLSKMELATLRQRSIGSLPRAFTGKLKFIQQLESGETLIGAEEGVLLLPEGAWDDDEIENRRATWWTNPTGFFSESAAPESKGKPMVHYGSIKDLAIVSESHWYIATSDGVLDCRRKDYGVVCTACLRKRVEAMTYDQANKRLWVSALDSIIYIENSVPAGGQSLESYGGRIPFLLADNEGGIWMGTQSNGVFRLRKDKISHWDRSSGLPSNVCSALFINAKGEVLVGTDKGLACLSFSRSDPSQPRFAYHDERTGLADNHVLDIVQTHDTIWLATRKGLSFWVPGESEGEKPAPVLVTESISVNGRDTVVRESYELAYWQNSFSMHFFDPAYRADAYQYRCMGLDTHWSDLPSPTVEMPFLAPGRTYEVQVRASSAFKSWGRPTTISFHIREAFFQSTLFFFLLGSGLLGAIGAVFAVRQRNRYRMLREREQFQQRIAQLRLTALKARMNPHFIFNSLNAIQHLVVEGKDRNTFDFISGFSKLIRRILDNSDRDFIPLGEEIELCRLYLEVESRRLHEDFEYELEVDPGLPGGDLYIPTMIIQPFLENAIWHGLMPKSGDRRLTLSFRTAEEGFRVVVEDNGVGRAAAQGAKSKQDNVFESQSTRIFDQRIALLNKSFGAAPFQYEYEDLKSDSGAPSGTRLTLTFPLVRNPIQF